MNGISLTASMRSNLLSLQTISGQVSSTQNKLATGNKVNSAIDNPSSYYTALSLNNRADDLNALLDSMGQAVSTIKAATTALESATEFLEQAKAVANQALETAQVPDKSFFEEKVGENGVVVTTAQELRDAVNSDKETICIYGQIDYFENETLTLKTGQKLVGTEYFTGYSGKEKFSQLNFKGTQEHAIKVSSRRSAVISDLSITFDCLSTQIGNVICQETIKSSSVLNNLDITFHSSQALNGGGQGAICSWGGDLQLSGHINIDGEGHFGGGIFLNGTKTTIGEDAIVNLKTKENKASIGIYGIMLYNASVLDVYGTLNIEAKTVGFILPGDSTYGGNTLNIHSGSKLSINSQKGMSIGKEAEQDKINTINILTGAQVSLKDNAGDASFTAQADMSKKGQLEVTITVLKSFQELQEIESQIDWNNFPLPETEKEKKTDSIQYAEILNQYDALIKDAGYKGINLLQPDKLTVKFNEDNSSALEVTGKDMSTQALGFTVLEWQTQGDINKSIEELTSAINAIRNYSSELGNNYNIITTRQDFTESLINVLTEGADKLTLADMNEESANMLALQTRQQLAINSLSLASQASQSILKLF